MLKNWKFIAVFAMTATVNFPSQAIEAGQAAWEFSLPGTSGEINLRDFKGKVVYIDFWASWCGPCKKSFPWMNAMQSKYGPQGFKIIAINLDANSEDGKRFLSTVPANFAIAFDAKGVLPRQYQIKGMPSSLLIGRDGKILSQHTGFNDASVAKLEAEIASFIQEK
jgi:cytochrome c biogenesis protein CcmG/thiol:disulfide interchange protein DsbE